MGQVRLRSRAVRRQADAGTAAIEFAIIVPIFLTLLFGIMVWGNYFWLSHTVQQIANDAARAAIAGMDSDERQSLASSTFASEIGDYASLTPTAAALSTESQGDRVIVTVTYNASGSPFWALGGLVPTPSKLIKRQATVRLGGY